MQNKYKQYRTGVNHTIQRDIPVEWDVLAAATPKCLVYKKADFKIDTWLEIEKIEETPVSVTWRLWSSLLGEFGFLEVRKIRAGFSCIEFSGIWALDDMFFRGGHVEMWNVKVEHHREIVDNYFFMLADENIFTKDEDHAAAIHEKRRAKKPRQKKQKGCLPTTYRSARKWVLVWDAIEKKIKKEPDIENNFVELRYYLQQHNVDYFEPETLKKIIACGKSQGIPTIDVFEENYNK